MFKLKKTDEEDDENHTCNGLLLAIQQNYLTKDDKLY